MSKRPKLPIRKSIMPEKKVWSGLILNGEIVCVRRDSKRWTVKDFENNVDDALWPEGKYSVVEVSVEKIPELPKQRRRHLILFRDDIKVTENHRVIQMSKDVLKICGKVLEKEEILGENSAWFWNSCGLENEALKKLEIVP